MSTPYQIYMEIVPQENCIGGWGKLPPFDKIARVRFQKPYDRGKVS